MTNKEILAIAIKQSAYDSNANAEDFLSSKNKIVISQKSELARRYLQLPFCCDLTSYGNNIIASVSPTVYELVEKYINKYSVEHCFETPNMQVLNTELQKQGFCVCFMAEYFLPDVTKLSPIEIDYETRVLTPDDFNNYYNKNWSNALCEDRRHLDMLGIGAFLNGELIGLAGCSADCDTMWQIGIDVLPEHRRNGIAAALTSNLAIKILNRGIVPFYCAAWSNIKSVRNAIASGFKPSWVQLTAKPIDFVNKINNI